MSEPGLLAAVWHQTGLISEHMGEMSLAEDAYQQSLKTEVQNGKGLESVQRSSGASASRSSVSSTAHS